MSDKKSKKVVGSEEVEKPSCAFAFEDEDGMVNVMAADVVEFVAVMDYVLRFKKVQKLLEAERK